MIPTKPEERTVRGPYFSDRPSNPAPTPNYVDNQYSDNYPLMKMFKGNNGRTSGGLR